jgi:hypothetical protein
MKNHPSKSLVAMAAIILWGTSAIFAQERRSATSESRRLRFVSGRSVEHLQLRVHDRARALIYDSGLVAKSDLVWSLRDNDDNVLQPGLYNWALTVKERGKSTAIVKRGTLNLEHTNGRPSIAPLTPITGGGEVVAMPKLTMAADIGDSVTIENNGAVAIGVTPSGITNLRVFLRPPENNADVTIQAVPATPSDQAVPATPSDQAVPATPSDNADVNDASAGETAGRAAPGSAMKRGMRNQRHQGRELRQERLRRAEAHHRRRGPHFRRRGNRP